MNSGIIYGVTIPYLKRDKLLNIDKKIYTYKFVIDDDEFDPFGDLIHYNLIGVEDFDGRKIEENVSKRVVYLAWIGKSEKKYLLNPLEITNDIKIENNSVICFRDKESAKVFKINYIKDLIKEFERKVKLYANLNEKMKGIIKGYELIETKILHKLI